MREGTGVREQGIIVFKDVEGHSYHNVELNLFKVLHLCLEKR